MIGRTDTLNLLVRKTDDMAQQGTTMYTGAVAARNELWWRRFRNYVMLGAAVVSLGLKKGIVVLLFYLYFMYL